MSVKLQTKGNGEGEKEKNKMDPITVLLSVSKVNSNCFCLRGTVKLENAFGPWGCEQESLVGGGYRSDHVCTGGYIIDYLKQQKSAPHKPAAPKRIPKPTRNILGYIPRINKQADSRNIAAFQHLSSYEEYSDFYRMSKAQHQEDLGNLRFKQGCTLTDMKMKAVQNTSNAKPARLLETFRINTPLLHSSEKLCNQPQCQELDTRSQDNFYSSLSQTELSLPLLNIRELEIANPAQPRQTVSKKSRGSTTSQNQALSLPVLNVKDVETVNSTERLWVPKDAVFQQRNNSVSMHHSRGYYSNCKRPVYSQQTERSTFGKNHACISVYAQHPEGMRIQPKCCNHLIQARVSEIQISVDATALRTSNYTQDLRQIPKRNSSQLRQFLPLHTNGCEARLVSRARIFFGESNEDKGGSFSVEDTKLPKLSNTEEQLCLQQEGKSQCVSLPAICGPEESKSCGDKTQEHVPEPSAISSSPAALPPTTTSGSATNSYKEMGLKSPKKWEEEYLHKTPRGFIFSRQHMLFSMESVNKRLLENGIKKSSKKERSWLQPSRKARRTEEKHRSSLDNGEVEAPFGTIEKHDAISKCFMKSMERQKSKRPSKVITGRTLCSNIPQVSSKTAITLTATGKSYKDSTVQTGRENYSEDELTYE